MKKSLLLGVTILATATLSFLSYQTTSKSSGAPSGVANDPASGMTTCTDCHSGTATSVNVTGLSASTTYHFAVYEFNTASNCYHLTELVGNFTTLALTPSIALSNLGTQVTAAFVAQGTTSHVLHKFQLAVTVNSATFTNLAVVTAGTYVAADVSNLKLIYSADNVLDGAKAATP